jgi:hypothetical protein
MSKDIKCAYFSLIYHFPSYFLELDGIHYIAGILDKMLALHEVMHELKPRNLRSILMLELREGV